MKKILIAASLLLSCLSAKAQFVIGGGYCNNNTEAKLAKVETGRSVKNGVFVEIGYDKPVTRHTSIMLLPEFGRYFCEGNRMYTKVPVQAKYIFAADSDLKLFIYGGPLFYFTLAKNSSDSFDFSYDDMLLKRYNVYLGAGLGAEIHKHLRLKIGYDADILNEYIDDMAQQWDGVPLRTSYSTDFTFGLAYVL